MYKLITFCILVFLFTSCYQKQEVNVNEEVSINREMIITAPSKDLDEVNFNSVNTEIWEQ